MSGFSVNLLLVDDDELDRYSLKRALASAKFEATITEAETAEEALSLLADSTAEFHCAIFDFNLPGRDGSELLREMRLRGHYLPVIFLTGQGSEQLAVELMKSGAADYIPKSALTPSRLVQCLHQAIQISLANQLRQRAEDELRQSEQSYRTLTEHLPDVVIRFDHNHRHVYANRAPPWASTLPLTQLFEETLESICPEDLKPLLIPALLKAENGETTETKLTLQEERGPRHYLLRAIPEVCSKKDGTPTVLFLTQDITKDVEHEKEILRGRNFERQLIGIVSHDLRNPISAVLMCAGLLRRQIGHLNSEDRTQRLIEVLETSAQRATRLVTDILDFTKARLGGGIPIHITSNNLGDVCSQILAEIRATHPERNIDLLTQGDLQGGFDGERIGQALANLLLNAIVHGAPDTITVRAYDDLKHLYLSVENKGNTLSEDTIYELFEPYRSGKEARTRNLGLGLFIVRHIVEAHQGKVSVTSQNGVTTFDICIPRGPLNPIGHD